MGYSPMSRCHTPRRSAWRIGNADYGEDVETLRISSDMCFCLKRLRETPEEVYVIMTIRASREIKDKSQSGDSCREILLEYMCKKPDHIVH